MWYLKQIYWEKLIVLRKWRSHREFILVKLINISLLIVSTLNSWNIDNPHASVQNRIITVCSVQKTKHTCALLLWQDEMDNHKSKESSAIQSYGCSCLVGFLESSNNKWHWWKNRDFLRYELWYSEFSLNHHHTDVMWCCHTTIYLKPVDLLTAN